MKTLREAREAGKLKQFIKERAGETGDAAAFDRTLSAMAGTASKHKPVEKPE